MRVQLGKRRRSDSNDQNVAMEPPRNVVKIDGPNISGNLRKIVQPVPSTGDGSVQLVSSTSDDIDVEMMPSAFDGSEPFLNNDVELVPNDSDDIEPVLNVPDDSVPLPSTFKKFKPVPSTSKDADSLPSTTNQVDSLASTSNDADPLSSGSDDANLLPSTSDDADPVPTCRLRHGLNEDCLYEIFKYLDVYNLIQLCRLDVYYENLINQCIIGRKWIDFNTIDWPTEEIFKLFGKSMRKIKINEEHTLPKPETVVCFERFLNFVIEHCSVGGLTEVDLRFSRPIASATVIDVAMPFFANLRKLVVLRHRFARVSMSYKQFLTELSSTATNLTHLTLVKVPADWQMSPDGMDNLTHLTFENVSVRQGPITLPSGAIVSIYPPYNVIPPDVPEPGFFATTGMKNLKEFRIISCKLKTIELSNFLRTKSKLEVFSYIGSDEIYSLIETIVTHCPKLQVFMDFHSKYPYRNDVFLKEKLKTRYNAIQRFDGVKVLGLTAYTRSASDLYYAFDKIAAGKKIETMKIYINLDECIEFDEDERLRLSAKILPYLTHLNAVELQIDSTTTEHRELDGQFLQDWIGGQTSVRKFCMISENDIRGVNKFIDAAPHLDELDVSRTKMKHLPVEMRKIVLSIRKRRANLMAMGEIEPKPFHVVVEDRQWRELMVYKDVDVILTTSIYKNP